MLYSLHLLDSSSIRISNNFKFLFRKTCIVFLHVFGNVIKDSWKKNVNGSDCKFGITFKWCYLDITWRKPFSKYKVKPFTAQTPFTCDVDDLNYFWRLLGPWTAKAPPLKKSKKEQNALNRKKAKKKWRFYEETVSFWILCVLLSAVMMPHL